MKPIYKSLTLASETLQVTLSLNAQTYDGTTTSDTALPAEVLDSLRVELVAPNVSGARDLIKSGECTIDGSDLSVALNAADWIKGATYRLQVLATFGTQTQVIYALDITVPYYIALSDTPQGYEDPVTVVSTIGDGTGTPFDPSAMQAEINQLQLDMEGKADGQVYRVGESGDPAVRDIAKIFAHSVEMSSQAEATGLHSVAEGSGKATGENAHAEGSGTNATSTNSHAEGVNSNASRGAAHAEGSGTTARGYAAHAEGGGTIASADYQHVSGKYNLEDNNGLYALIVGNGTSSNSRSNAFAIDWDGNLVLFNAGTPVILTPAKLATLIA